MSDFNPFDPFARRWQNTWATSSQLTAGPSSLQAPSASSQPHPNPATAGRQAPSGTTLVPAPTYSSAHTQSSQQIDVGMPAPTNFAPVFFIPVQASSSVNISQAEPVATDLAFTAQVPAGSVMPTPQVQFAARQDPTKPTPLFRRTALSQIQAQNSVTDSMRSSSLPPRGSKLTSFTGPHRARSFEQRALRTIKLQQACQAWNERGSAGCPGDCNKAHICKKCLEWLGETEQHPSCECDNGRTFVKDATFENGFKKARRDTSLLATQMEVDTPLDSEQASNSKSVAEDQPCLEWNLGFSHPKNCGALHVCRECFNLRKTSVEHMEKDCFYYHRRIKGMDTN
ncbi:hypothetical protein M407DRAFT_25406 [Tulasnella calospora MUT 4182]|uniref:Uncharacterized protein n=1 Tax=Tulasnella calospora MUT 4182 TaxID=1051891 RepID=A0A0C3QHM8_9AGAM|nr:hypothetical protein M407DRAFT_25406 [Tulasnella calospora MUT 4182]